MSEKVVVRENTVEPAVSLFVPASPADLLRAIACGAGVGLIVAGLYLLLDHFLFSAVLCRPQAAAQCNQAPLYSHIIAMVVGAIAGLGGLVRLRVYRPLLIVLAATITLWGLHMLVDGMAWYWMILASVGLFALAYGLYAWLARVRNFIVSLVVMIIVVVVMRLLIAA